MKISYWFVVNVWQSTFNPKHAKTFQFWEFCKCHIDLMLMFGNQHLIPNTPKHIWHHYPSNVCASKHLNQYFITAAYGSNSTETRGTLFFGNIYHKIFDISCLIHANCSTDGNKAFAWINILCKKFLCLCFFCFSKNKGYLVFVELRSYAAVLTRKLPISGLLGCTSQTKSVDFVSEATYWVSVTNA